MKSIIKKFFKLWASRVGFYIGLLPLILFLVCTLTFIYDEGISFIEFYLVFCMAFPFFHFIYEFLFDKVNETFFITVALILPLLCPIIGFFAGGLIQIAFRKLIKYTNKKLEEDKLL